MIVLKRFLVLATPFWFRRSQWREWALLATVVGFALAIVHIGVRITQWNKTFYDALAVFDGSVMPALIVEFLLYITLMTIFVAVGNWIRKVLLFRWRAHLTQQFEREWLDQHKHYLLQLTAEPDNPDQRIAEDIYLLSEKSIDLFKYFIMNAAKLVAFIAVLWQMSGIQSLSIGSYTLNIHGYLVWIALIYSVFCTWITHLIGHKLQDLNVARQHREADYRATLLRIRDHSSQIAFYRGEVAEQSRLKQRFDQIRSNWFALIGREFKLESFSAVYLRLSMFIPIAATLPLYLAHKMTFGDMMSARSAFSNVQDGFGWFMDYYKRLIEWSAVVERLAVFQMALNDERSHNISQPKVPLLSEDLLVENLTISTALGRILLQNVSFTLAPKQWLLIEGASGIGKSTLLKTLAGLWPYHQGDFTQTENSMFLPQRPYLPQDSLRATVSYPHPPCDNDARIQLALKQVGLSRLGSDLDRVQEWHQILSGGEQQRLSLVRVLLNPPAILLLDEATNQLDAAASCELMLMLKQALPDTSVAVISHQFAVQQLFEDRFDLEKYVP